MLALDFDKKNPTRHEKCTNKPSTDRDGRNLAFRCSIGVLYVQINLLCDALSVYSRAIRINPHISEVCFDLGSLHESCNNRISDVIDTYARASELNPCNPAMISQRLQLLKWLKLQADSARTSRHPSNCICECYRPATYTPLLLQSLTSHRSAFSTDSRGPSNEITLPPPFHHKLESAAHLWGHLEAALHLQSLSMRDGTCPRILLWRRSIVLVHRHER